MWPSIVAIKTHGMGGYWIVYVSSKTKDRAQEIVKSLPLPKGEEIDLKSMKNCPYRKKLFIIYGILVFTFFMLFLVTIILSHQR